MNDDRALKQRFLDRAKALSNVAEVFRCSQVTMLICETVAFGVRAEAKIFQAAYGDPSGQKYWDAHLSEPIPVYTLAHVLSAHLAEKPEQVEMARIAIIRAFRDAAEAGERWFTGETTPLLAVEMAKPISRGWQGQGSSSCCRRMAAEETKTGAPCPPSLRRFLQSGGELTNAKAPTARRPVTKKKAERFVANYIKAEQAAGRSPTLGGLEAAAKNAGMRGAENICALPSVGRALRSSAGVHLRVVENRRKIIAAILHI